MIDPQLFCAKLAEHKVDFFCGVPDSLLKHLCAFIDDQLARQNHVITANEGNAIAMAAGHYLSSGKPAAVYMQNSGLGNAVNPLTSLADRQVYSIPMLMIIGWRGEPGVKDEPQHVKQGAITEQQLDIMEIPYQVIDAQSDLEDVLPVLFDSMVEQSRPVALLVRKGTFASYNKQNKVASAYSMKREQALGILLSLLQADDIVVSTTGKTSREVFEIRRERKQKMTDFLTVGAMGHTSSIALGAALGNPNRRVIAIDGDGSMLMHMGSLPIIGAHSGANFIHVLLNNQSHESVGGQPTVAGQIDLQKIALASGYNGYWKANSAESLQIAWKSLIHTDGPVMLEVDIAQGARSDLGRPTRSPIENKHAFMRHVGHVK